MISIITPVYMGARFIESCIRTVISQNCHEVEHIIVDGGSTDGSVDIIKEYAAKHPHIRWVSERDTGQSAAMNKGITMAQGDILGFLNVDDYYEPEVLNRVSNIFQTLPIPSLLVGNCNVWDNDGNLWYVNKPSRLKLIELLKGSNVNPHPVNPSAYFYHASLHSKIGLYDSSEHYALDYDFLLRAVQVANAVYVDETWGNFRMLEGTKTVADWRSGQSSPRMKGIIKRYRKNMPLFQRWYLALIYECYQNDIINRLRHYIIKVIYLMIRPKELMSTLKRRFKQCTHYHTISKY